MPTYSGADGTELHYDSLGEGWPVIVIGGGAPRGPEYLGTLAGLDQHYRLLIPHLRGVGRSPGTTSPAGSWWHESDDIDQLRQALKLDRVLLLAHSSGTRLALSYAAKFADRVAGLVLVTPPAGYLVDAPSDTPAIAARRTEPEFAAAFARLTDQSETEAEFQQWISDTAPAGYAQWREREREHARVGASSLANNRTYFSIPAPDDMADRLRAIAAPVLVISGAEDALTGVDQAVALAALFERGTTLTLADCGHYPWVEQPALFADAVRPFIERSHLIDYVRSQQAGVVSTLGPDGEPQSAYLAMTATDAGELVFDAKADSRKVANLHRDPRIAVVVGGADGTTLQLEGTADFANGAELARVSAAYLSAFPQFEQSLRDPSIVVIRVVVSWSRYGDYRN